MDYAICQALKQFPQHTRALIIYDICCQWIVHFRQRISESEFMELWESLQITSAVGKWHLAAHIAECFTKYTLNFIEGAAQVDGEILETLWSPHDEVVGLTQAMSVAHRQESLDTYINDSNWWKIVRIGTDQLYMHAVIRLRSPSVDALCGKWTRAKQGVSDTKPALKQLTDCLEPSSV